VVGVQKGTKIDHWWQRSWLRGIDSGVIIIAGFGFVALALPFLPAGLPAALVPSMAFAVTTCVLAGGTSWALWRLRNKSTSVQYWSLLLIAGFVGFAYVGWGLNVVIRNSTNPAAAIAQVRQQLPTDAKLVSLGRVHHLFAFYYGTFIRQAPRLANGPEVADVEYFCFAQNRDEPDPITIPFEWEQIAVVSCDRAKRAEPTDMVVVGRRITKSEAAASVTNTTMPMVK
jgi:hypothetical protein